jgi:hypothetical protein
MVYHSSSELKILMTYSNNKSFTVSVASVFGVLMLVLMFQYIRVFTEAHPNTPITAPIATPTEQPISGPIDTPVPTPTETPAPTSAPEEHHDDNNGGGNNNGGGESHNDNHGSEACTSEKPKTAPVLLSWTKTGVNQVTLHWSKVAGVQYYTVSFGLKSHKPIYGDPHVGDGNTTSTVINGLSGSTTYFFTIEAGKGCVHSDSSNEVSVKINGAKLNQTIVGFKQIAPTLTKSNASTSLKVQKVTATKPTQDQAAPAVEPKLPESKAPNGFVDSIHNFFKLIFS